jgi:ATP:corrinoid adenosyltransferase
MITNAQTKAPEKKKKVEKKKEIFNNKIANSNQKKGLLSVNKGTGGEARQ